MWLVYHVRSATCFWRVYTHTHINKFWLLNKGGNFDIINDHAEVDHKHSLWIYEQGMYTCLIITVWTYITCRLYMSAKLIIVSQTYPSIRRLLQTHHHRPGSCTAHCTQEIYPSTVYHPHMSMPTNHYITCLQNIECIDLFRHLCGIVL